MENLQDFDALAQRKKWSKEELSKVQAFIKEHHDTLSPLEKLDNRFFAIKTEMTHYILAEEVTQPKTIGAFIKEYIKAAKELMGISQKRLGTYWGVSNNLGKYLSGERGLNADLALKIAATFNVSPELLLDVQKKNQLLEIEQHLDYKTKYSLDNLLRA